MTFQALLFFFHSNAIQFNNPLHQNAEFLETSNPYFIVLLFSALGQPLWGALQVLNFKSVYRTPIYSQRWA